MMIHRSRQFAFVFVAAMAAVGTVHGEAVELRNGDIIHGKVLALDANVLRFQSESFGDVRIDRSKIATIHLHDRPAKQQSTAPRKPQSVVKNAISPDDILQQLQSGAGVTAEDMKAVQQQVPLVVTPEVKGFVNDRLSGLMTGRLDILDIREEAIDAVDQIKDLQKDLGPQANAFNGYLSILESFIRKTEPKQKVADEVREPDTRELPKK